MFNYSGDINQLIWSVALSIVPFLLAITTHEASHAYAAYMLGDNTAKDQGRLTLNPIVHISPVGLAVLLLTRMIGWAKPVPVNPYIVGKRKYGMAIVAIAGPLANITLLIISALLLKIVSIVFAGVSNTFAIPIMYMLLYSIQINIVLAVFNLIPIPPLDGSRIVMELLPRDIARHYAGLERYGMIIVIALMVTGVLPKIVFPIVGAIRQVVYDLINFNLIWQTYFM